MPVLAAREIFTTFERGKSRAGRHLRVIQFSLIRGKAIPPEIVY